MILGTAGHIDHGKTSLVRALTGMDTDRLKEEKSRGITIELGFAHLDLDALGLRLGVVDVPGHERFIRHMVAGAGGIDVVMMVVAADEGVMPQTREHLEICQLMEVEHGLVVMTKTDLVEPEWLELVEDDIREAFAETFLEEKAVVPFSVKEPASADAVRAEIVRQVKTARAAGQGRRRLARLPIDRVFTVKGFGTVVTGTLLGGGFAQGDEVDLIPSADLSSKIRKLQMHGEDVARVEPGNRVAINLAGVARERVHRGQVVVPQGRALASSRLDVELALLEHVERGLKDRGSVLLHTLTQQVNARVVLMDREMLGPSERCFAQLVTEEPVAVMAGDRFVLRGFQELKNYGRTLGGGRVLDPIAPRFRRRALDRTRERLEAFASGDVERALQARVELSGVAGIEPPALVPVLAFPARDIEKALDRLRSLRQVHTLEGKRLVGEGVVSGACGQLVARLEAHHEASPLSPGLSKEAARMALQPTPDARLFGLILRRLEEAEQVLRKDEHLRLASFIPPSDPELEAAIVERYRAVGLAGFALKVLATEALLGRRSEEVQSAGRRLLDDKVLLRVKPDYLIVPEALEGLRDVLLAHFASSGELSIPVFRDLTGLSRKHMIPLIEFLDRKGWTRRQGDVRVRGPAL